MRKHAFHNLNTIILDGNIQAYANARAACGHLSTTSFANAVECYLLTGDKTMYDLVKKDFLHDLQCGDIKHSQDDVASHMTAIAWALKSACKPRLIETHKDYKVSVEAQFDVLHDVYTVIEQHHASFGYKDMQLFHNGIMQCFLGMLDDDALKARYQPYTEWLECIAGSYHAYAMHPKAMPNDQFALIGSVSSLSPK